MKKEYQEKPICVICGQTTRGIIFGPKHDKKTKYVLTCSNSCAQKNLHLTYFKLHGKIKPGRVTSESIKCSKWIEENSDRICRLYAAGESILGLQQLCETEIGVMGKRKLLEGCLTDNGYSIRGFLQHAEITKLEKTKRTNLQKFGHENVSQSLVVKRKKEETCLQKFGVKNAYQSKEKQEKIRETNIKRYGVINPGAHSIKNSKRSGPHQKVEQALTNAGISFESEVKVPGKIGTQYYCPRIDIVVNGVLAVEIYGDYFHANPAKYKPTDLISLYKGKTEARIIWEKDQKRVDYIQSKGYNVIVAWEYDIKRDIGSVIERILHEIGNFQN